VAYVGTHRALRPLPLRHPVITAAALTAVLGVGAVAAGISLVGRDPDTVRTTTADGPALVDRQSGPSQPTPALGVGAEPSGSPRIAPVLEQSTTATTHGLDSSYRTRRSTVTSTTAASAPGSTRSTSRTSSSTRTSTKQQTTSSTTATRTTTTTSPPPPATTTTTADSSGQPAQQGAGGAGN
jgi:hypothetical protein